MKKIVLITGASGNLGRASVERFTKEGYSVIATVSPGKTLGFEVNGDVDFVEADLSNENSASQAVQKIIEKHKTIDAALLLVGGFSTGTIGTTGGDALRKMFAVNFDTAYFAARPIFKQMISQSTGGRIVFIGARPALNANDGKNALAYALSKSLIFKLAELLNAEGAANNVVSTVIVPSIIDTPVNRQSMPQADFSTWVKPEEIADAMAFMAGDSGRALREPVLKVYAGS